jgi:hypothetical protein
MNDKETTKVETSKVKTSPTSWQKFAVVATSAAVNVALSIAASVIASKVSTKVEGLIVAKDQS